MVSRKSLVAAFGLLVGIGLLLPAVVSAQDNRRPQFGPVRDVAQHVELIQLAAAQSELDYRIPEPAVLPPGYALAGAFFVVPTSKESYPDAAPDVASMLAWQARLRPVALLYVGPRGPIVILRASITVGRTDSVRPSVSSKGLDLARGALREVNGFQYRVRFDVDPQFLPVGHTAGTVSVVTWRYVPETDSELTILDSLWTIFGALTEEELVGVALSVR